MIEENDDLYEAFGGDEIGQLHPCGWVYVSDGVWVDKNGEFHEW